MELDKIIKGIYSSKELPKLKRALKGRCLMVSSELEVDGDKRSYVNIEVSYKHFVELLEKERFTSFTTSELQTIIFIDGFSKK